MAKKTNNEVNRIGEIFNNVIEAIDTSRDQILDIVEAVRIEYEHYKNRLETLNVEMSQVIKSVDNLHFKDQLTRNKLAEISKGFTKYTEADIKDAYEKATQVRVEYMSMQGKEKTLRVSRDDLEQSLIRIRKSIDQAEKVVNQVTIATGFLKGELRQVMEEMGSNKNILFGIRVLEAQEFERKRISRDIHDGPAQHIANIVMKADIAEKIAQKDMAKGLEELKELKLDTRKALKEVRGIIYNLRPMSLDDLGLIDTVKLYVKKYEEEHGIQVKTEMKALNDDVELIIEIAVFRLIQEILNNVKKHAKAESVYIAIESGRKYIRLTVIDDGLGFDVEKTLMRVKKEGASFGLLGLYERVDQLNGEIDLESSSGFTEYNIKLPISREVMSDD